MAAALRSIGAALGYASHTNPTVAAPSGIVDGDTLCLVFCVGGATPPTVTLPSGFSNLSGSPWRVTDSGYSVDFYVATKTAASESGGYTVTHATAASDGVILCVSGSDSVTSSGIKQSNGSNGTTETANSVTAATAGALIAYLEHNWDLHGSMSVPTASDPPLTEQFDSAANLLYVATGVKSTAGATGAWSTADNDNVYAASQWQTLVLAFEAASGGGAAVTCSAVMGAAAGRSAAVGARRAGTVGSAAVRRATVGALRAGTVAATAARRVALAVRRAALATASGTVRRAIGAVRTGAVTAGTSVRRAASVVRAASVATSASWTRSTAAQIVLSCVVSTAAARGAAVSAYRGGVIAGHAAMQRGVQATRGAVIAASAAVGRAVAIVRSAAQAALATVLAATGLPVPDAAAVWAYLLPNGLTAGATLAAVHTMLRDLYRIHGLEVGMPLGVTATARTAGPIVQTIAEGGGTVTVERTA